MTIQVLTSSSLPKEKGDLLENLATEFLKTQNFSVENQVRSTGAELDLLCKHNVNSKVIYVECKAHSANLSANVIKNLIGTIDIKGYAEGWLVSTASLSKDAKGLVNEWMEKSPKEREKLSVYSPDKIIEALQNSKIIQSVPQSLGMNLLAGTNYVMGEWTLLITSRGKYWSTSILESGIPCSFLLFNAIDNKIVNDPSLLEYLKNTKYEFKNFDYYKFNNHNIKTKSSDKNAVIEVEVGELWSDYRPARPEHFVGRTTVQKEILKFFTNVKGGRTENRIFAIKGGSGIGKSSLIAKMREIAFTTKKPNNIFLYAVDMRAANNASYIHSSLLKALLKAREKGFGIKNDLAITNYLDPLQSNSINSFLNECKRKNQLIILVLDQFEELYSKAELFPIFEETRRMMFSVISASSNLVLGFAWKTDSTVPQDHPAYHMWHKLSDHRYEITLKPFNRKDAIQSIRIFEKELNENLLPELNRYLIENSQGYPWLLKKLCIHIYEQIKNGINQFELSNRSLDISSLFDQDINNLTNAEVGCLRLIAKNAPMDWYEILESTDIKVVQSLQNKRLLLKRGTKLNLYWDIFRDYIISGNIPSIPFSYIPRSPSLSTFIRVISELDKVGGITIENLSFVSGCKENTVGNILHDLEYFGIIRVRDKIITSSNHLENLEIKTVLLGIRTLFKRHALTIRLKRHNSIKPANNDAVLKYMKEVNPTAQYSESTWLAYKNKMIIWLQALGLVDQINCDIIYNDKGDIINENDKIWTGLRKGYIFLGEASPAKVVRAFDMLKKTPESTSRMKTQGYNNACKILYRFRFIELNENKMYQVIKKFKTVSSKESVWEKANEEESVIIIKEYLKKYPVARPVNIGDYLAKKLDRKWTNSTCKRIGTALKQWSCWIMTPKENSDIPIPPGRCLHNDLQSKMDFED